MGISRSLAANAQGQRSANPANTCDISVLTYHHAVGNVYQFCQAGWRNCHNSSSASICKKDLLRAQPEARGSDVLFVFVQRTRHSVRYPRKTGGGGRGVKRSVRIGRESNLRLPTGESQLVTLRVKNSAPRPLRLLLEEVGLVRYNDKRSATLVFALPAYCQGFLSCLFLHFQSIHLHFFFQNLSRFFPVLALANTWFLCRPAE